MSCLAVKVGYISIPETLVALVTFRQDFILINN